MISNNFNTLSENTSTRRRRRTNDEQNVKPAVKRGAKRKNEETIVEGAKKAKKKGKSEDIPTEKEGLEGKTFVFTGDLSIEREEAQNKVKRYGGRVTTAPSSRTTYLVVGDDPGPKKVEKAKELGISTLNEEEFFDLIKSIEKKKAESTANDNEEETEDKSFNNETMIASPSSSTNESGVISSPSIVESKLWVDKYKPKTLAELCGNKIPIEKLQKFLRDWDQNLKRNFPSGGKDDLSGYRAVLISGTPGIGKTTAAHLVGELEGYDIAEYNASDTRSKKSLEAVVKIATTNTSITSFYRQTPSDSKDSDTTKHGRALIIMDEVDGMSVGDRGGIVELMSLIKKTQVPIICICNDRASAKIRSLVSSPLVYDLRFQRENLKLTAPVVDELVRNSHTDIRQVLNMMSSYKLTNNSMDYDQGLELAKASEKNDVMNPWDVTSKYFNPHSWKEKGGMNLNEKIELYFHDSYIIPLMIQENYIKTKPTRATDLANETSQSIDLATLELRSKAADAICFSDRVNANILGTQQNWSLMPFHAIMSCVTPASYIHGSMSAQSYHGGSPIAFPSWLGNYSKTNKYQRRLQEIQSHMRPRISGDKNEVRQSYIPALIPALTKPLIDYGNDGIPEVIEKMDEYFLTKEDWDVMLEMGLAHNDGDKILKKISSAVKSAFTRKYNSTSHPTPYTRGNVSAKAAKAIPSSKEVPDIEEAIEVDEILEEEESVSSNEDDLTQDKNIKKKSGTGKGRAAASSSKKTATASGSRGARGAGSRGGRGSRGGGRGRGKK
ncbi:12876_t:CDS:10 [Ambispora leptoticha]|uniref:Replication factor C subunit 1 n=1 Tax=Ambispora leptoticha TaxID=144679 RepID=A0A9N8ZGB3_9GLOM|nr:12876_t:CDS:10 [Ambispora leptoticha]